MGKGNEGMYIYRRSCRSLSLMSCLTVSFSCGVVYSRGNRTPESEKKQTSVYLVKRKMKENFVYVPGTYISPFVVALAAGVNSYPSSREVLLEDGKSETGPKQLHTFFVAVQQQSCSSQETQPSTWLRIASLHLAETLRPTALPLSLIHI